MSDHIPVEKWEATYRSPSTGDDRWYRTPPMPYDEAVRSALATTPEGFRLIRVERVPHSWQG